MEPKPQELTAHLSTLCTLEALRSMKEEGVECFNIADIGCGDGILSMQATAFWPHAKIIAGDISEQAVRDATANIAHAGLEGRVAVVRSDGYSHPAIQAAAPFDLVLCNMLAKQQVEFARELEACMAPGGLAVLSGILPWFMQDVIKAHMELELLPLGQLEIEQWNTIILKKLDK